MDFLSVKKEDYVAYITMNNPPVNAFGQPMKEELIVLLDELEKDDDVHVLVLTGAGDKAFMAGADINRIFNMLDGRVPGTLKDGNVFSINLLNRIANYPKVIIASINGLAFGAGFELSLCCDMIVACESATFGLPEVTLGLMPGGGGTQRLTRIVGPAKTKEIMMTGSPITAAEAYRIGLVTKLVPDAELEAATAKLAKKIARNPFQSVRLMKEAVNRGQDLDLQSGITLEQDMFDRVFQSKDAEEGVRSFVEKRKPVFTHK